jgi:hypothetical protein
MKNRLIVGLGLMLFSMLGGAFVFGQEAPERLTVTLDKPAHFLTPDGGDVVLTAGEYTAKSHGEKSIQVTAIGSGEMNTLQAEAGTHEQQVSSPTPMAVASEEDVVHIVLLMPGGTTLDAIGTLSGVRTRGQMFIPLPPQPLAGAMTMRQQRFGRTPVGGDVSGGGVIPGGGLVQEGGVISGGGLGVPQKETQLPFQTQPGPELQKTIIEKAGQKQITFGGAECSNVGPDGKFLTAGQWAAKYVGVGFTAKPTGPFSVELSWTGPPLAYVINEVANINDGGLVVTPTSQMFQGEPSSGLTLQGQQTPFAAAPGKMQGLMSNTYTYRFERPRNRVLPDFTYKYTIRGTLPDGRLVCGGATVKTLPEPIAQLPSVFVNPSEVRLGFVRPPHAEKITIFRKGYVEDGRQAPFDKMLAPPEIQPSLSHIRSVNPGLPPLPQKYNQPIVYNFLVEAVWQDDFKRTSTAKLLIRVNGPEPLWGWADLHTHPMSNLAFGGKIFHGGPDVGSLLPAVDVPKEGPDLDHLPVCLPDHRAASIDQALGSDSPTHGDRSQSRCGHPIRKSAIWVMEAMKGSNGQPGNRLGAPDFSAWPKWNDITHQKMWVEWIRRAHEGGLRVLVALSHNNRLLGDVASVDKVATCNMAPITCVTSDKLSSDLQIKEMKDFVVRHSDFMQVARTPAELYGIVRSGKLAVVLGIEIDNIGDFNRLLDSNLRPRRPTPEEISREIQDLYDDGVRYIFPIHVTDNVFGDTAPYEAFFQAVNVFETGQLWKFGCAKEEDEIGFHAPINVQLQKPFSDFIQMPAALQAPICSPDFGHRNSRTTINPPANFISNPPANLRGGLTPLGEFAIKEMMKLGMIVDIDHMSHLAVERSLQIAENIPGGGYPLMSGHNGIRDRNSVHHTENNRTRTQLGRIGCLGGMFGLGTDGAESRIWAAQYRDALNAISVRAPSCSNKELGLGAVAFGTDTNSLVGTPKPLLEGLDMYDRQLNVYSRNSANGICERFPCDPAPKNGLEVWDFRTSGVAHYGMFADFVKAVWSLPDRKGSTVVRGQDLVDNHLSRNADNFWRMWVKIEAQKNRVQ